MPRNILIACCLLASLLSSNFASAEIYKTVDKNGRVTYSDTPPPNTNATPVELKPLNTTPPPTALPDLTPSNPAPTTQAEQPYVVQLIAPANGTTLMPNERSVTLSASLSQNLQNGDLFAYKIDGAIMAKTSEYTYVLNEPPRGEHTLSVDIVDTEDNSLAQSEPVTLLVMRPIIKQPPTPVPKK